MKAKIKAISYYLPEKVLSNESLIEEFPEWSVEKIASKTGIYERRIVDNSVCSSDIAILSCRKLFEEHDIRPSEIEFLIFCTQSPDYFLPTTACIIQDKLEIPRSAGAFDYNLGCSGYVYGLSIAKGLIESGAVSNVLLVTADTYSKFLHPSDKSVRTIFGDGASATFLSVTYDFLDDSIGSFVFGTDGRGANNLIVKNGGMRNPVRTSFIKEDDFGNLRDENSLYMNGSEIFIFTLNIVPKTVNSILFKANLSKDEIDLFVFHQANQYMLNELRKKLKIPEEKFYLHLEKCGNTVSSTIPIALYHAFKDGKISKGSKVMVLGFGVGYSWAGAILKF